MKIFQYIYYFFRSIYYRGISNTFKLLAYEGKYEKQLGIKTHSIENLENLTLAGNSTDQNHHYQGASYHILYTALNKIPIAIKNKTFIDYGCGKGRAIFVAEQCGFKKLVGVDIAKELIDDANDNKTNYQQKNADSIIEFVFCDATQYNIPNDAEVFYFFNPFGAEILNKVATIIKESVKNNPREVYCIYLNPKYASVFNNNGFIKVEEIISSRYLEGIIYSYK